MNKNDNSKEPQRTINGDSDSLLNVERRDNFWKSQNSGNGSRNSDLINSNNGIGSNDSTSRKINTLAHQVSSHTPFLSFEALRNGLDWSLAARKLSLTTISISQKNLTHFAQHAVQLIWKPD
jgi:hypothetical protein